MRRFLSVILLLAMTLCCSPFAAAADLAGPLGEDAAPTLLDTGRGYVVYYWYSSAVYYSPDGGTWTDLSDRAWVREAAPYTHLGVGHLGHREFELCWMGTEYMLRRSLLDDPRSTHRQTGDSPKNSAVTFLDEDFQVIGELAFDGPVTAIRFQDGTYYATVNGTEAAFTREDWAKEHFDAPGPGAEGTSFADVAPGDWFAPYVETCAQAGVMVGTSTDTFSPNNVLTDAECLMLGWRLYDQARGGDGSLPKAPENWGAVALKTDNGLVDVSGYLGEDRWQAFYWDHYRRLSLNLGVSREVEKTYAPCGTKEEPTGATLIFEGVEHRGQVYLDARSAGSGQPPICSLVFLTDDETLNQALTQRNSGALAATPDQWWRDLSWAIQQESGGSGQWDYSRFPLNAYNSYSSRFGFAQLLAAVTDLPKRYDVTQIPDLPRDEARAYAYRLYEAGVMEGVDEYGTFQEYKSLTRAEAAAMVARVLDESLRLTQAPRPMPQEGADYTLTYLMEGEGDGRREPSYPLYHVMAEDEAGQIQSLGALTLEGRFIPWPEGWTGELQHFSGQGETMSITLRDATGADRQDMQGIMDRNGTWLVEPGRYVWVAPLAYGGFFGAGPWDKSLGAYAWYDILDENGQAVDRVEHFEELEKRLGTGEDAWENWGGLTLPASWHDGCLYFLWPDGTPATNWLDSAGRIGPDGKGFVEKDGKIYRIQFEK